MVTTSFRDDEEVLEEASNFWEEGPFSDKSDFYRFARDFALDEFIEDYEPSYENFEQRLEQLDNSDQEDNSDQDAKDELEELVEANLLSKDQIEIGFQMYISGWANSDLKSAEKGIDILYDVDEDIGDIAKHYLETSNPEYWA